MYRVGIEVVSRKGVLLVFFRGDVSGRCSPGHSASNNRDRRRSNNASQTRLTSHRVIYYRSASSQFHEFLAVRSTKFGRHVRIDLGMVPIPKQIGHMNGLEGWAHWGHPAKRDLDGASKTICTLQFSYRCRYRRLLKTTHNCAQYRTTTHNYAQWSIV